MSNVNSLIVLHPSYTIELPDPSRFRDKKFVFIVKDGDKSQFYFNAPNAREMREWMFSLTKLSVRHRNFMAIKYFLNFRFLYFINIYFIAIA